jgi:hypothetical protein
VLPAACYAAPDTVWTFRYAGTAGGDYQPLTSFVDARSATGHVYVAGWAQQPTGGIDALLLKISADSGHLVWDKTYPDMTASGAAMDTSGNVYIAGVTTGATAAGKLCVLKYFPNGDTDWTRTYGEQGLSFTSVGTIALDDSQNVYACGRSDSEVRIVKYRNGLLAGVISYIPSSQMPLYGRGQFHILRGGGAYLAITCERQTGSGRYHWLIAKLSSQSQVLWERVYRDTSNSCEWVNWSQVDEDASIYLTGVATSAVYGTEDFRTIKMDSLGDTLWTREYIGPEGLRGVPRFLMLDKGSVYIAGWSMHHEVGAYQATALVKYDSLGSQQWASRYGTADDTDADVGYENIAEPTPSFCSIDADDSGNVYLTGYCLPGTDAVGILLQYDAQGNLVRERELSSPDERWFGATIAIDGTGSPYETGVHVRDNGYLELFVTKFRGRQR